MKNLSTIQTGCASNEASLAWLKIDGHNRSNSTVNNSIDTGRRIGFNNEASLMWLKENGQHSFSKLILNKTANAFTDGKLFLCAIAIIILYFFVIDTASAQCPHFGCSPIVATLECTNYGNGYDLCPGVTGGCGPYSYAWSDGSTTNFCKYNVPFGTNYCVTISDNFGCTASACATANCSQTLPPGYCYSVNNVIGIGGNNGSIVQTCSVNPGAYSYLWSNGETTASISNLTAGVYTLSSTDNLGSSSVLNFTIAQTSALILNATTTPVTCNGGSNGTVTVNVTGGMPPYSYLWSTGATTQSVTGLAAGPPITLTVIDPQGDYNGITINIPEPPAINITVNSILNVTTNGAHDGNINLTVSGGTSPYSYLTTAMFTNCGSGCPIGFICAPPCVVPTFPPYPSGLEAGSYSFQVTDANGCTTTLPFTIQPSVSGAVDTSISIEISSIAEDTIAHVVWTGATGFNAQWIYLEKSTDSINYTTIDSLSTASLVDIMTLNPGQINSFGQILYSTEGGVPHFMYNDPLANLNAQSTIYYRTRLVNSSGNFVFSWWRRFFNPAIFTPLPALTFIGTCPPVPTAPPNYVATRWLRTKQYGCCMVTFRLYQRNCNANPCTNCIEDCNCTYDCYCIHSCSEKANCSCVNWLSCVNNQGKYIWVVVNTTPVAITITPTVTPAGNGYYNATYSSSGGTAPYNYVISPIPNGIQCGITYTVTATDNNGCTGTVTLYIPCPPPVLNFHDDCDSSLCVNVSGGVPPYSYQWNTTPVQTTPCVTGIAPCTDVTVTVWDANGSSVTQTHKKAHLTATIVKESVFDNDGSIDLHVDCIDPNCYPLSYVWSQGSITEDLIGLSEGTYCVTITDNCGNTYTCCFYVGKDDPCVKFADGYTTNNGWTTEYNLPNQTQAPSPLVTISGGKVNFNQAPCDADYRVFKSLPQSLPNQWRADFQFKPVSGNVGGTGIAVSLFCLTAGTQEPYRLPNYTASANYTNQDFIEVNLLSPAGPSNYLTQTKIYAAYKDGATSPIQSAPISFTWNQIYYARLERLANGTSGLLSIFSDAARTIHIAGSPLCFSIPSTVTGLNTLQHATINQGSANRDFTGWVDSTKIDTCNHILCNADFNINAKYCFGSSVAASTQTPNVISNGVAVVINTWDFYEGCPATGSSILSNTGDAISFPLIAGSPFQKGHCYTLVHTVSMACGAYTCVDSKCFCIPDVHCSTIAFNPSTCGGNGGFTFQPTGGDPLYTINIIPLFGIGSPTTLTCNWYGISVNNQSPGHYMIIVTDANGCSDTCNVEILPFECCPANLISSRSLNTTGTAGRDYNWKVISRPNPAAPATPQAVWYQAYQINQHSAWSILPASSWISHRNSINASTNNVIPCTFQYQFCLCKDDSVTFNFCALYDNNAVFYVDVLGNNIPIVSGAGNGAPYVNQRCYQRTIFLTAGTHTLRSDLYNFGGPAGLDINGTVSSSSLLKINLCPDSIAIVTLAQGVGVGLTATLTAGGTNVTCNGSSTGQATATAILGTGPFIYTWSNGATTATATGLVAGMHQVTITDANGTLSTDTIVLTQPAALVPVINGITTICAGGTTNLNASAGYANYLWSTSAATQSILVGTGGTYTVTVTNSSGCTGTASKTIVVSSGVPAQPLVITGPAAVCKNTTVTFTIAAVAGATSYTWTANSGASVISGQGSTTVVVNISGSAVNSSISVVANNVCGSGAARTLAYLVSSAPPAAAPATITGPLYGVCNQTVSYTCPAVANTTSYLWTVPAGATILSGLGTVSVSVKFTSSFAGSGTLSVQAVNGCGISVAMSKMISGKPQQPVLTGQNWACKGLQGVNYSVAPVAGATSYTWTVVTGSTIAGGQGTTSIVVNWGTINGIIKCKANNACGSSLDASLAVSFTCREAGSSEDFSELSIYPNPATTSAQIQLEAFTEGKGTIAVYDMIGKQVLRQDIALVTGNNNYALDLSALNKGAYMVQVIYNDFTRNSKLIVQ